MASIVFLNGCYQPELSDVASLPAGIIQQQQHELKLSLPDNCHIPHPVKFIYRTDGMIDLIHVQQVISLGKNSRLTLVDKYEGNVEQAAYAIKTQIIQQQNSSLSLVCLKNGAKTSCDHIHVVLAEPGAECKTAGFYHVQQDNQSVEYHLTIEHAAAHTTSDMLFKGVAENKSCTKFYGKLHVHPHAQKIMAQQANHNLMLTPNAEMSSKPELEIYADDVKCKHGSTTGQLDQDALFYLRARGVAEDEAKRMLVKGFAEEVRQRALPFETSFETSGG